MSSPSRPRKSEDVEGLKASIFKAIRGAEISHHEKKDRSPELWFRRRSRSRSQESDTASTSKAFAKSSDIKRASTSSLVEEKAKSISRDGKGIGINDSQSIVRKNIISDANDYQLRQSNLLQKREDRYSRLKSPGVCFSLACAIGDLEMVKNLLHQKPELIHYAPAINHGYGGLHYAAKGGHIDVARYLLRKGANINLQTVGGYTALHLASICGKQKMVGVLVKEYYADSAVEDIAGYTYEFYASWPVHDKPHAASLGSPIGMWPGSQTEHAQFSRMGSIRKALTGFFSDALSTRGGVA